MISCTNDAGVRLREIGIGLIRVKLVHVEYPCLASTHRISRWTVGDRLVKNEDLVSVTNVWHRPDSR